MSTSQSRPVVLITGATGFIASHTIIQLLEEGYDVVGIDNLANSKKAVINRITALSDRSIIFRPIDIRDEKALDELFTAYPINSVIHFAGYKAVGESVEDPMLYYSNNMKGTTILLEVMAKHGVKNLVFSSSCTVYGNAEQCPITEESPLQPGNPYGRTKWMIEHMLSDLAASDPEWHITSLRYFNPIGAHPSGEMGEDPSGIPNNLIPYITQVAIGKREKLYVFGGDYPTEDGTCIRDYIHVCDLAAGHIAALESLHGNGYEVINLGTGKGYSVLEVIKTFEKVSGVTIPYEIVDRREGDAVEVWADPTKAYKKLYWRALFDLERMCNDAWLWQLRNPEGYRSNELPFASSEDQFSLSTIIDHSTKITLRDSKTA